MNSTNKHLKSIYIFLYNPIDCWNECGMPARVMISRKIIMRVIFMREIFSRVIIA